VFAENFTVYGVRKIWRQMMREPYSLENLSKVLRRTIK